MIKGKRIKVQPRLGRALVRSRYATKAPENVMILESTEPTTDPVESVLIADPEKSAQEQQQEEPRQKRAYRRRDMQAE